MSSIPFFICSEDMRRELERQNDEDSEEETDPGIKGECSEEEDSVLHSSPFC